MKVTLSEFEIDTIVRTVSRNTIQGVELRSTSQTIVVHTKQWSWLPVTVLFNFVGMSQDGCQFTVEAEELLIPNLMVRNSVEKKCESLSYLFFSDNILYVDFLVLTQRCLNFPMEAKSFCIENGFAQLELKGAIAHET